MRWVWGNEVGLTAQENGLLQANPIESPSLDNCPSMLKPLKTCPVVIHSL